MDENGTPNSKLLSLGCVGKEYGGSLSLWSTVPASGMSAFGLCKLVNSSPLN
jgi:hypothetical protein